MSQFFNVGDEVVVRQYDDMMQEFGHTTTNEKNINAASVFVYNMRKYCGECGVVINASIFTYNGRRAQILKVKFDNGNLIDCAYIFSNEMFEPINVGIIILIWTISCSWFCCMRFLFEV